MQYENEILHHSYSTIHTDLYNSHDFKHLGQKVRPMNPTNPSPNAPMNLYRALHILPPN